MKAPTARRLYGTLLGLLSPLYALRLWWRGGREPLYRQAIGERFGRYTEPAEPGALWIHAVSLGETRAAAALVTALRYARPGLRLLLTHGTATGREAGRDLLRPGDRQVWLPYDTPAATARFLAWFKPAAGVLMETEVWPHLLQAAASAGVPMVLANARLSERSRERGDRFGVLLRPAFGSLALVLAQSEADAERLRGAGARRVQVSGNLKFDVTPGADLLARGRVWRAAVGRPVLLAASTREGEEASLLAAWRRHTGRESSSAPSTTQAGTPAVGAVPTAAQPLQQALSGASGASGTPAVPGGAGGGRVGTGDAADAAQSPSPPSRAAPALPRWPLLVIVPRHPQRFDAVAALVEAAGLRLARRSAWAGHRSADPTPTGADRRSAPPHETAARQQPAAAARRPAPGPAASPAGNRPPPGRETPPPSAIAADVWLGDSLGEMPTYYALAQVALLGGSFEPLGGQNLIEAAACGCPLVMGPHTYNFAEAARLALLSGAALRVDNVDAGVREALALLGAETQYLMAARAMGFAAQHRGAARRMAAEIVELLAPRGAA